ncbi:uncharacterized protein LOC122825628 [Gambusia affinis]|uniref:uncharacterized protein LOC122825628 n=1 Tax=Gambusia affinis TaxID=33528 RepID=UPI001CDD8328|nr:uncharacterized protein LOC122825628 [Gambusia affinis]
MATKRSRDSSLPNIKYEELSLGLLNIYGLRNKTHEVKHIIARDELHVVALCETKLNSKVKESKIHIPGFRMWRKDRNDKSNNTGGGVALYIQDHIKTRLRPDLMNPEVDEENPEVDEGDPEANKKNPKAEIIWVEMELRNKLVLLGCCYRPTKDPKKYSEHIKKTITLLSEKDKDKDIFLMGDFNIDWLSNSEKKEAEDFISSKYWTQIVKVPTRLTLDTATCIDHIYTNVKGRDSLKPESIPTGCSDHNLITVKAIKKIPQSKVNFRKKLFDKEKFQTDMKGVKWNEVCKLTTDKKSLQEALNKFINSFLQVADKHAPLKSQNIYSLLKLNETLEKLVSDRDTLKYKMIKNIYPSIKEKKKLQEKIDNYVEGKPENQPGGENDATESKGTVHFHLPEIEANPQEPTDSASGGGQRNRRKSGTSVRTRLEDIRKCLEYVCDHVVMFIDETEAELIKLSVEFIDDPIRKILDGYKTNGEFPCELKKIKSFPFSIDNYIDYRQSSSAEDRLHIILGYIFDVILYEQLFNENEKKSKPTFQENLKQLKTDLVKTNRVVEAVLLDFTSSFDKISHDLLITKLNESNLSESDLKLIKSFLSIHKRSSGLPGGSCLTQLVHIIIINDLKETLTTKHKGLSAVICNSYIMIYGNKSELKEKKKTVRTWADKINISFKDKQKKFEPSDLSAMFKILESMIRCHGNKSNWIRAPGNIVKQNGDWEYDNVSKELELHFGKEYIVKPEIV